MSKTDKTCDQTASQNEPSSMRDGQNLTGHLYSSFFGRRKGKPLSPTQQSLLDDLYPRLKLNPQTPLDDVAGLFSHEAKEFWLEIGFGGAEHMVSQAQRNPDVGLIGCEPFVNGMVKALAAIQSEEIETIRLYDEDAAHILDWLPEGSLDRIFLLYPDPWHKKRHWKRRFVSHKNLERFARVLKKGGIFRFASDIDSYVEWTLDHIARCDAFAELEASEEQRLEAWPDWKRTRYEAKAYREGRRPHYLTFQRL